MRFAVFFALGLACGAAFGTEIDDTTSYYADIPDAEAVLNAHVQRGMDRALEGFRGCSTELAIHRIARVITGNLFFGEIETYANFAPEVPRVSTAVAESIFRGAPFETSLVAVLVGLGPVVNVGGRHVGTDKLGHFLDQGYRLYLRERRGLGVSWLVLSARFEEEGPLGAWTTGVKSYGDIAANLDGWRFWRDVAGVGSGAGASTGAAGRPFFVCEDGSLRRVREFRFSDYASDGWIEALNCSEFADPANTRQVRENERALEAAEGRRYVCPIEPDRCLGMRQHYARWFPAAEVEQIVSPRCRAEAAGVTAKTSVDDP